MARPRRRSADDDRDRRRRSTPGRPDAIDGAPGAMLVIISGPSGVGQGHDHRRAAPAAGRRPGGRLPLRRHVHDPRTAAGRGRRRRLPLRRAATVPRAPRRRRAARGERGPRQLVRHAARPGPGGARGRPGRDPQDRRPGRPGRQGAGDRGAPDLRRPAVARGLFQRLRSRATETADELEIRQRNAAIELARQGDYDYVVDERDRPGRADGRPDRRDHRRASTPPPGPRRVRV